MTTLYLTAHMKPGTPAYCCNCRWTGTTDDVGPIRGAEERMMPGEQTPAGECPDCEAFAYLVQS